MKSKKKKNTYSTGFIIKYVRKTNFAKIDNFILLK